MIQFQNVSRHFGEFQALDDITFDVEEGELLVLIGQSGSGKTTILRLLNRLVDPTSGTILVQGEDIQTVDPIVLRRRMGYAIQHIGLFLHMTVRENVGVVPRLLKWDEERIQERVDELLNMVGLPPNEFGDVAPTKLSGGQKQRVGVARALAADPPIILMDEPFGALDPLMRVALQDEFLEIQSKIQKTVLFVTHDLKEAQKMGDRIAFIENGKLVQIGTLQELTRDPIEESVEEFLHDL